jgi:acyl-CoA synthetase (AMP-forming)/AMP-acid ligase II
MPHLPDTVSATAQALRRLSLEARALAPIARGGLIGPTRPNRLLDIYRTFGRYGPEGALLTVAAIRHGDRLGLIDEIGGLTFAEMDRRSNALAHALQGRGIGPGCGVGILCRNHRGVLDATFAVLKCGGRALYLNTDFGARQAEDVCAREGVEAVIYDREFADVVRAVTAPRGRFIAWTDGRDGDEPTLEALIRDTDRGGEPPPAPPAPGSVVILTSGTTGTPKGANRGGTPLTLTAPAAILSRIPFRGGGATYVASPVYHAWGLAMTVLAMARGSTVVLRRRFDPEATLDALAEYRCTDLTVVPVALARLLALGPERISAADLSALRIVACSGAQLNASLATQALDVVGDVLYNLYGTTEVAWATIATPADLRAAPGCAGKAPFATTVRIYDDAGRPAPSGTTGRIFVGSGMEFGGYTGGGTKETIDGLMSTGDVGHFDRDGRLWVDGRDDEMIVSGGENVFPREVEDLLAAHEAVAEAAARGVDDDEFGQRLQAWVVVREGSSLDAHAVKDYVRANLARYKVPRDVFFVDELPRNPSGKVLKRELAPPGAAAPT